ncbi:MAG: putative RNA uridine N3 methyltransferase [Candidatus Thermoplasmatota archaeon]|nr:putative RNA uridine N3 methyltransferase [Candidatus Thermoplasmatota archaeon]
MKKYVLIPNSFGAQERDPKIRALLIGQLARVATMFRIAKIIIYPEPKYRTERAHTRELVALLRYANTPQWLRKYIFKREPELSYAGVLTPLQAPHHPELEDKVEHRFGYVKEVCGHSVVDVGLKDLCTCNQRLSPGKVMLFRIKGKECEPMTKEALQNYFGYEVELFSEPLREVLKKLKAQNVLILGTSKYGTPIEKIFSALSAQLKNRNKVAIAFGSYAHGFLDWFSKEECQELFDLIINVQSTQGTKTIRTEEALFLSLEIIDLAKKMAA